MKSSNNTSVEWRDVKGYEGIYKVSSAGQVKSLERWSLRRGRKYQKLKERPIKIWKDTRGYPQLYLCREGKKSPVSVHRLVAIAFIPNPEGKRTVNHKNGKVDDNRVLNLEWMSQSENNQHAHDNGLMNIRRGETHPKAKLTQGKANEIRKLFTQDKKMYSVKKLAQQFRVHEGTIRQVLYNKTWKT